MFCFVFLLLFLPFLANMRDIGFLYSWMSALIHRQPASRTAKTAVYNSTPSPSSPTPLKAILMPTLSVFYYISIHREPLTVWRGVLKDWPELIPNHIYSSVSTSHIDRAVAVSPSSHSTVNTLPIAWVIRRC